MSLEKKITRVCLIAGEGQLPIDLVQSAKSQGVEVVVFALNQNTYKKIKNLTETYSFGLFQLFEMIQKAKDLKIKYMTFIGKVPKLDFFKNLHKFNPKILQLISQLKDQHDDSLHSLVIKTLEQEHGFEIIDQTLFIKSYFPKHQIFTNESPSAKELEEINHGLHMAKGIAALDIGQTVIVKNKSVIAVEGIEGTSACIKRAAKLISFLKQKNRFIVCKVSKPNQDRRFDVPTVGLGTVDAMPENSILAFEAEETLFVEQEAAIEKANKKKIIIGSFQM